MVHGDHEVLPYLLHLSVDLRDLGTLEKQTHREPSERDDNAGVDDLDLVLKIIAAAGFDLLRQRIAVSGWAALDQVRDPYIRAGYTGLFEQFIEELSRRAHERPALLIFVKARSFANEHDLGMRGSFARDGLLTRTMELALGANHDLLCKFF
jgi:hypothetical protein